MTTTVALTDRELALELCQWLDDAGVGVWSPSAPYSPGAVGIYYGAVRQDTDSGVGVAVYGGSDPVGGAGVNIRAVQVRYRGPRNNPTGADALADLGFAALHGEHHRGGIARVRRVSFAPIGADDNGRQERTDNFEIILNTPPLEAQP